MRDGRKVLVVLLLIFWGGTVVWAERGPYPVSIPMRDGRFLAADVYLPDTGAPPYPVILIQTPYNRLLYRFGDLPLDTDDYAWVIVDWRGFWGSMGAWIPNPKYGEDGFDCVEWIASQPQCNGCIGTWGASALGVVQFQTAREHPPHLKACVPIVADSRFSYGQYYPGGVYRKEYVEMLDLLGYDLSGLILAHPTRDWFWILSELLSDYPGEIEVPMLIEGGWYDLYTTGVLHGFRRLSEDGHPSVRDLHRLLMGPWEHSAVDRVDQGELTYPEASGAAAQAALAFLDYWVLGDGMGTAGSGGTAAATARGTDAGDSAGCETADAAGPEPIRAMDPGATGADGRVNLFDPGSRTWFGCDGWPLPGVEIHPLYLRSEGRLLTSPPPPGEASDPFPYDPRDPSPTWGGAVLSPWMKHGPCDQREPVEARGDVLVYTTPTLPFDLALAGKTEAVLYASSDRADTDFMVRLTDVYPDGRSMLVTDAARRGRFRDGFGKEKLMEPGEIYEIRVELSELFFTFPAGHRLRIDITSSNYPRFDRNLNNGGEMYAPGDTLIATNLCYHEEAYPSRLLLPVRPAPRVEDSTVAAGFMPFPFRTEWPSIRPSAGAKRER